MSLFVNAFDSYISTSGATNTAPAALRGENGTLEYSSTQVGDCLVAFFFALVRDLPDDRLQSLFMECVTTAKLQPRLGTEVMADLFVLAFQTRDCRGGKGERALFYKLFLALYKDFPQTCQRALPLISEYGSFRDHFQLLAMSDNESDRDRFESLRQAIIVHVMGQLKKDDATLTATNAAAAAAAAAASATEGSSPSNSSSSAGLSLCAKYCPREGSSFAKTHKSTFKAFLTALFPETPENLHEMTYRKFITRLTSALDVVEVKMCAKQYSLLDFTKIPSLCMKKYRKAFLNEKLKEIPSHLEDETGNRFPSDVDRVQARKNLRDVVLNKSSTIKGGQLYPHDLCKQYMGRSTMSTLEKDITQAQWVDLRTKLVQKLEERHAASTVASETGSESKASAVDFGKLVPLVDVSGSMSGIPMEVAIALGILISEINNEAFRDHILTFHSDPSWVSFAGLTTLEQKVQTAQAAPWGMSTDLEKAFALIEEVIRRNKLDEKDVPDLIIFSDMQFDSAVGTEHLTQLQRIERRFHNLGMELKGKPYARPRIVFWNLRGDTGGFPATASTPNVQMLSGYSPSLFNALVSGESIASLVDPENPEAGSQEITPYETMRSILDDSRYDSVREVLSASSEGTLGKYRFERPVPDENAMDSEDNHVQKRVKMSHGSSAGAGRGARGGGRGRGRGRGHRR